MDNLNSYTLFCDESVKKSKIFSNFYGGILIKDPFINNFERDASKIHNKSHLKRTEFKYTKIKPGEIEKHIIEFIDLIFKYIKEGKMKYGMMYAQNIFKAKDLTPEQKRTDFTILYCEFIKGTFGFNECVQKTNLHIKFDQLTLLPETKNTFFNKVISFFNKKTNFLITKEQIQYVVSKESYLIQAADLITGLMQFKLNKESKNSAAQKYKRMLPNKKAKLNTYNHLYNKIKELSPPKNIRDNFYTTFNIGQMRYKKPKNLFEYPYWHFNFGSKQELNKHKEEWVK